MAPNPAVPNDPENLPPRQSTIVASQSYPLRLPLQIVKVLCHSLQGIIAG